MKCRTAEISKI